MSREGDLQPGLPGTVLAYACCQGMITHSQTYPSWDDRLYSHPRQEECPRVSKSYTMAGVGTQGRLDSSMTEV